jgi:hypothetical protein
MPRTRRTTRTPAPTSTSRASSTATSAAPTKSSASRNDSQIAMESVMRSQQGRARFIHNMARRGMPPRFYHWSGCRHARLLEYDACLERQRILATFIPRSSLTVAIIHELTSILNARTEALHVMIPITTSEPILTKIEEGIVKKDRKQFAAWLREQHQRRDETKP